MSGLSSPTPRLALALPPPPLLLLLLPLKVIDYFAGR